MRTCFRALLFALLAAVSVFTSAGAQVLARPGWAGSGVAPEPWWRRAVFYRIQPALFQASNDASVGDLHGVISRLSYIQQLGVDAIVLRQPFSQEDFGDLVQAASQAHLRVLVQLTSADPAAARMWLTNGAAGLYLDARHAQGGVTAAALAALRHLTDSFPGQRVLLAAGAPPATTAAPGAELTVTEDIAAARPDASVLRQELENNLDSGAQNPLLDLAGVEDVGQSAAQDALLDRALALMLFGSRAAVLFDAGRELGLLSLNSAPVIMQWTPTNVTAAIPPPPAPSSAPPPQPAPGALRSSNVYGTYVPYVPPKKIVVPPPGSAPPIDTLPGFTAGKLPENTPVNGMTANAASEDREADSLLNFYRQLIALHHGDWTLRNGAQAVLDYDAGNALVWVRTSAPGAPTFGPVVAACNLSGKQMQLDLDGDLEKLGLRGGGMRTLAHASARRQSPGEHFFPFESTGAITLAPETMFLGEITAEGGTYRRRRR